MWTEESEVAPCRQERSLLRKLTVAACTVLAVVLFLQLNGCSLIGWGIGRRVDKSKPKFVTVQSWQVEKIPIGKQISVSLTDGRTVSGTFQGTTRDPIADYNERYAVFAAGGAGPTEYPAPGDTVQLSTVIGTTFTARLVGYDLNAILVQREEGDPVNVLLWQVAGIEWQGHAVPPNLLTSWMKSSRVPLLTVLLLSKSNPAKAWAGPGERTQGAGHARKLRVPISDVAEIHYANARNGAMTGFIIGLAVDVVVVVVVLNSNKKEEPPPPPPPPSGGGGGGGSCPLIYSHDGRTYVLDAEVFSGAILKRLQQTDYASLDHLRAVDGLCRIKVGNPMAETHYVDQMELIAVDHPRGIRVLPEGPGRWRTISSPQRPVSATDYTGSIMTHLVAEADSLCWISNPLGRDPGDPADQRDGLVLRFARPGNANQVKLVLTLRNTPWLTEIEHRLLELPGAMLGLWYAQMNASAADRQVFTDALQREVGLRVDVWEGNAWRSAAYLPFVGPSVPRSFVLPLDLAGVRSADVRIRIESAPGMWMVDCVEADFGRDVPVSVTRVTATTAVDRTGGNVLGKIAAADDRYLRLEPGDEAAVAFSVAAPRPGLERSYVVLCNGYYTVHVQSQGLPQLALMRQLAREPGRGGAYATGVINRWISGELSSAKGATIGEQN